MEQVPRITVAAGDQERVYQILQDVLTVGAGQDADIRVRRAGFQPVQLRLEHRDGRLFAIAPSMEHPFEKDGVPCFELELDDGDTIRVGDVSFTYRVAVEKRSPTERSKTRSQLPGGARHKKATRRRRMPRWLVVSNIVVVAMAGFALLYQEFSGAGFSRTSSDLLRLAQQQWERGRAEVALNTLESARSTATDDQARGAVAELDRRIRVEIEARWHGVRLRNAETDLRSMRNVEERYLIPNPEFRPAARELLRLVRQWYALFGEHVVSVPGMGPVEEKVQALRRRYEGVAAMHEGDTVEDVLFAARWRIRIRPRRVLEALDMLEQWLNENGEDPAVRQVLDECLEEGRSMARRRLELVGQLLRRKMMRDARSTLEEVEELAVRVGMADRVGELRLRVVR